MPHCKPFVCLCRSLRCAADGRKPHGWEGLRQRQCMCVWQQRIRLCQELLPAACEGHHQCGIALPSSLIRRIPWVPDTFSCACVHSSMEKPEALPGHFQHIGPKRRASGHCSWMHTSALPSSSSTGKKSLQSRHTYPKLRAGMMSWSERSPTCCDCVQVKTSDYDGKLCITVAGHALSGVAIAVIVVVVILGHHPLLQPHCMLLLLPLSFSSRQMRDPFLVFLCLSSGCSGIWLAFCLLWVSRHSI